MRSTTHWTSRLLFSVLLALLAANAVAKEETTRPAFTFFTGPYPSKGLFEYKLDAGEFMHSHPAASGWTLLVERDGKQIKSESHDLPRDGKAHGYVDVGPMPDGAAYLLTAIVAEKQGKEIARQSNSFTRKVMPFEKSAALGTEDVIVAPFTKPVVEKTSVSCWGRTYQHRDDALLSQIVAAGKPLFSRPAVFSARVGDGKLSTLEGARPGSEKAGSALEAGTPILSAVGNGQAIYHQTFTGQGVELKVVGEFDYDGFYKFTATVTPQKNAVQLQELRLDIPFRNEIAQLIEASVTWQRTHNTQKECAGELDPKLGILWDSKTFPSRNWSRIGNMPPFVWLGDDERGLVYSCASEQGMHDDENLPAAQLERLKDEVVLTVWFVNSTLELKQPRTFQFALQASPFKPMPQRARLWRNQNYRMPYKDGTLFTNWFNEGSYPTYGRFLTLDLLKKEAEKTGADQVGTMASSMSECGGTPEYLQFWHEWGSDLGWDKQKPKPPEQWATKMVKDAGLQMNPFIRVESASNVSATNADYRVWWFDQEARHSHISYIYQDNPPYGYLYDPPNGFGYTRDDGRQEPTSAIWNSRQFMKRIAAAATEAGKTDSPNIWANAISPVLPGRSFCRKMLNGEYLYTKAFSLGQIRVMASKQWGMELDWYPFPQTEESDYPNIGPVRKYWRAIFSRLLLHDITSISGADDAGFCSRWLDALDLFWLDDPTVVWHPYYAPDAIKAAGDKTAFISTYTAKDRCLLFVSNQAVAGVVEKVSIAALAGFGSPNLKYFYDAETGEEIENDGDLKLFIPGNDYRVVIGFPSPWKFAAKNALGIADLPAQSALDPEKTLAEISRQLLAKPTLAPIAGADRLYDEWMRKILAELSTDAPAVIYQDAKACSDIDFGKPGIRCSFFYDKKRDAMLVNYFNDSDADVSLSAKVRDAISKKAGKSGHSFIIHPITGISEWAFIDIPAHQGLLEIYYGDSPDFWGAHNGPFKGGNMRGNIIKALDARQLEMHGRPLPKR